MEDLRESKKKHNVDFICLFFEEILYQRIFVPNFLFVMNKKRAFTINILSTQKLFSLPFLSFSPLLTGHAQGLDLLNSGHE